MTGFKTVSVFRSSLKNKVENSTTPKRETEKIILTDLVIIDTCNQYLQRNISREISNWYNLELVILSW